MRRLSRLICLQKRKRLSCVGTNRSIVNTTLLSLACLLVSTMAVLVTCELQKGKYVYYRCSHGRGKCSLPYMREQDVSERLGELLKGIYVPETIAQGIVNSLQADGEQAKSAREQRIGAIQQRLNALRGRIDQMYEDKLDGKIDQDFWTRKMNEWREQERTLEAELSALSNPVTQDHVLTVKRIFELANRAYFLY